MLKVDSVLSKTDELGSINISLVVGSADPRLLGALRKTVSPGGGRGGGGVLRNGWNAFVHVSLHLDSCSRKALEKQYLFVVRFQLVFFFFFLKQETVRHSRYKIFT